MGTTPVRVREQYDGAEGTVALWFWCYWGLSPPNLFTSPRHPPRSSCTDLALQSHLKRGKAARPLCFAFRMNPGCRLLPGEDVTWSEAVCFKRKSWNGAQLWAVSSQLSQQLDEWVLGYWSRYLAGASQHPPLSDSGVCLSVYVVVTEYWTKGSMPYRGQSWKYLKNF